MLINYTKNEILSLTIPNIIPSYQKMETPNQYAIPSKLWTYNNTVENILQKIIKLYTTIQKICPHYTYASFFSFALKTPIKLTSSVALKATLYHIE